MIDNCENEHIKNPIRFSIVICTMNRPEDLKACLESITAQTYLPLEVIIVDASKEYASKKIVEKIQGSAAFSVCYIKTTPGLTRQRNIGIQNSSGDVVAFFDDDVVLDRDYLNQMAICFNRFPQIGGATGYIYNNPDKKSFESWLKYIFMLSGNGKKGVMLRSGFAAFLDPKYVEDIKTTEILSGCNMIYRKDILEEYAFDEVFEGYGLMEDVEFSHRVSKKKLLMFVKNARLVHNRSETERINLAKHFEMVAFNHYYIFIKNVKQSALDWIFFGWSHYGVLLRSLQWTVRAKNSMAIKGMVKAHMKIFYKTIFKT